jgi:hypothetical protein
MNPHTVKRFDLLSRKTVFLYSTHVKSTIFGEIGRILLRVYRILSYHKRRWLMEVGREGEIFWGHRNVLQAASNWRRVQIREGGGGGGGCRMTDKIKMRGKCSKEGKCDRASCTIIMQVGVSGNISFFVRD